MKDEDWAPFTRFFGLRLAGDAIAEVDREGNPIVDDTFVILLNSHHERVDFVLPATHRGTRWEVVLDTRAGDGRRRHRPLRGGQSYDLEARCLAMLRLAR